MFKITEIDDGAKLRFEMRNESGELESSFTFNPYDLYLAQKLNKVGDLLRTTQERKFNSRETWIAFDEAVAYAMSEALGGGQEGSIFRKYAPTEQLSNGQIFVIAVVNEVAKTAAEYLTKRRERFASRSFHYEKN